MLTALALVGMLLAPVQSVEQTLSFEGSGGFELRATFRPPVALEDGPRTEPVLAVLLLPERGRFDRDGNLPGRRTDLGAELAAALSDAGVASLRFDPRTAERYRLSTGGLALDEQRALFAWPHIVGDADRALTLLSARAEVDPTRLGVLAHGGGAYVALALATGRSDVAALALLAPPATGWRGPLAHQVGNAAGPPGSEDRRLALADLARAIDAVVAREPLPDDLQPFTRLLFHVSELDRLAVELAFDPLTHAARYAERMLVPVLPVLVIGAGADTVVPPGDAQRLAAAFERATLVELPDADHDLGTAPAATPPEAGRAARERAQEQRRAAEREPPTRLHPEVRAALAAWVARTWPGTQE